MYALKRLEALAKVRRELAEAKIKGYRGVPIDEVMTLLDTWADDVAELGAYQVLENYEYEIEKEIMDI